MDKENSRAPISKALAAGAIAVGVAAGSYGVARAASGSGAGSTSNVLSFSAASAPGRSQPAAPWGRQRSDETLLTGDASSKATAAAKAEVPNGTIVRVETDADGHAAFEAHMVKADGTPVTVYVDTSFSVVSVESR